MTKDEKTEAEALLAQVRYLGDGADRFEADHGSCRVTVGPNSPLALAGVERVNGREVHVEQLRLIGGDGDDLEVDGDLVYFRAADDRLSAAQVAESVDWIGGRGDPVEFGSVSWAGINESGLVHLEGRAGDLLVDATFRLVDFGVYEDYDYDDDEDDDDDDA